MAVERTLRNSIDEPHGLLHVTATSLFVSHVLAPAAAKYINLYQDVEVQIVASNSRLIPVLKKYESQPFQLSVLYPSHRQLSRKVRAFVDLLLAESIQE